MRLTENELAGLLRQDGRDRCPDAATLAALAAGELDASQRDAALDHLAACRDCAEEVRAVAPLEEWSRRAAGAPPRVVTGAFSRAATYALAASLVLPLAAVAIWQFLEIRRLQKTLDVAPRTVVVHRTAPQPRPKETQPDSAPRIAALETEIGELSQPQLNPSIIDIEPDHLRGGEDARTIDVQRGARFFNVILAIAANERFPDYALEIRDAKGAVLWRGAGLRRTEYDTFTAALPSRLLPAGRYELRVLGLRGTREKLIQTYAVRIRYD